MKLQLLQVCEQETREQFYQSVFENKKSHLISFDVPREGASAFDARLRINRLRVGCYCDNADMAMCFEKLAREKFGRIIRTFVTERARRVGGYTLYRLGEIA